MRINSFDIDGVIYLGEGVEGLRPNKDDVIITGRSVDESPETLQYLHSRGIFNRVYFNPIPFDDKTRASSGVHKAHTLNKLLNLGINIVCHFEDDPIQLAQIRAICPSVFAVHVNTNGLVELENVRHHTEKHNEI